MESTKYYLGLDVGGTNMVAGVVDENHQIIAKPMEHLLFITCLIYLNQQEQCAIMVWELF